MQKKSLETIFYSSAGVVIMLVTLIAANVILGAKPVRVDMTQEKAHTLSEGTKAVLKKLDTPVKVRFYCTQGESATPETVFLKNYARKVEDLLQEYKQIAGKNLVIEKYDPQPDSDAEDSARLDGIEAQPLSSFDRFYLGLCVSIADERVAIPFLEPNRERELEYDLTRAVARVFAPEKPTVGVMSALPVFGEPMNPMNPMMGMGRGENAPWTLVEQLRQDFSVKEVEMTAGKIDDDVRVLVVIHPKSIPEKTQYALDQFVLRGGKLIAFLDPQSAADNRQQNPMMGGGAGSSTLDKLLKAWGLQFDTTKVVADLNFQMQLRGRGGQPLEAPAWLGLTTDGINRDDIATAQIDNIWLPMAGAFTGTPVAGLKETVLLHSTKAAQLVEGFMARMDGGSLREGIKPAGVNYSLAVRLTGKFKSAFPDGAPEDPGETNAVVAKADSLKESKEETAVVLVGDADMVADDFALRKVQSPFGTMVSQLNANLTFAQNIVEQMAGDSNLIGVRSRATLARPFTLVKKLEAEAQARGQAKILELQKSLNDTQRRLSELQAERKDKDQHFILSPEQRAELENFRKKQGEVGRELRQAQKDLRREVVSLETRLKWINILAMPVGVTAVGIGIAFIKRKRTSAK